MNHRNWAVLCFCAVFTCVVSLGMAVETRVILGNGSPPTKDWVDGDVLITDPNYSEVKPSITSSPNGDLFAAVEDLNTSFIRVYSSSNGGKTWSRFLSFVSGGESRNPSIAYGEHSSGDKRLYVAYESVVTADDTRRVMVFRFKPDGSDWTATTIDGPFIMNGAADQVYPRIKSDWVTFGDEYFLYLTYAKYAIDYYPVFFSRTIDRGVTWTDPTNVTGGSENTAWATRPDIAFGTSGLFIAFVKPGWDGAAWMDQIWVTESNNYGGAFSTPIQVTATSRYSIRPAVAAARGSTSIVVAFTEDFGDLDIRYATSTDGGSNWVYQGGLPGFTLDHETAADLAVSDSGGVFHLAYHHELVAGGENQVWHSSTSIAAPTAWTSPEVINEGNSASGIGLYPRPSVTTNPIMPVAEEAAISWTDFRGTFYDAYFDSAGRPIFTDGFESGDTTAWSSTTP